MRAAWYERLGPAGDVLRVGEQPTPTAGPGEVRVKIAASGVNPADVKRRLGQGRYIRMDGPLVIPNSDGAGVIDQVGAGVGEHWLGQRVWLYNGQRGGRTHGTHPRCALEACTQGEEVALFILICTDGSQVAQLVLSVLAYISLHWQATAKARD